MSYQFLCLWTSDDFHGAVVSPSVDDRDKAVEMAFEHLEQFLGEFYDLEDEDYLRYVHSNLWVESMAKFHYDAEECACQYEIISAECGGRLWSDN